MESYHLVGAITRAVRADIHRDNPNEYHGPMYRDGSRDENGRENPRKPSEFEIILNKAIEERRKSDMPIQGSSTATPTTSPQGYGKIIDISAYLGSRYSKKEDKPEDKDN